MVDVAIALAFTPVIIVNTGTQVISVTVTAILSSAGIVIANTVIVISVVTAVAMFP